MDAVAYQMSFDKEQLALLCANYDRRIDSLGAENKMLKAENDKLQKLVRDALACVHESSRGFRTHPKTYRDLYSRAKKLGVDE